MGSGLFTLTSVEKSMRGREKFMRGRYWKSPVRTGTRSVKPGESWHLVELHGVWWAYEGEMPPTEAFQTHDRSLNSSILGPYPSRAVAEAMLRRSS